MNRGSLRDCKAILFDFGGTLDSDGEHWLDRFYDLYPSAGLQIPPAEIKRAFYYADGGCARSSEVASQGLRPLMKFHVHLQFQALHLEDPVREDEMAGAFCLRSENFLRRNAFLLGRLKRKYRLGLVSNFYGNVGVLCEEAGLAKSFDVILDSVREGRSKPDPEIFRTALARLGLPAERAIFVGDSYERDMVPSRQLGMKTIWMKGPNPRVPDGAGPVDAWISRLPDLEGLVF
jgi:FMN phosphatase YigB (HAD superfamily)